MKKERLVIEPSIPSPSPHTTPSTLPAHPSTEHGYMRSEYGSVVHEPTGVYDYAVAE